MILAAAFGCIIKQQFRAPDLFPFNAIQIPILGVGLLMVRTKGRLKIVGWAVQFEE
jgi:hypothetical protein